MGRMHLLIFAATSALALGSMGALADPPGDQGHGRGHDKSWTDNGPDQSDRYGDDQGRGNNPKDQGRHDNGKHRGWEKQSYRRGERLPDRYRAEDYYVTDYHRYHLRAPERGYRWVRDDDGQLILIAIATGVIADIVLGN